MNKPMPLKLTPVMPGEPEVDRPRPERLEAGNPRRETWNVVDTALPPGRLYAGVWRCEPGRWRIAMGPHEHELFTVLAGRCRIHTPDGSFIEAGPGEAIVLPAGFEGSFEVLEALTKTYAIVDSA
jgi:uncharacterized cupin superfamily protein